MGNKVMLCTGSLFLLIVATARLVSGLIVLTDQWLSPFLSTNTHNVLHFFKTVVSVTNKGKKKKDNSPHCNCSLIKHSAMLQLREQCVCVCVCLCV